MGRASISWTRILPVVLLLYLAVLVYGFFSASTPGLFPEGSDKIIHAVEFFFLAGLLYFTLITFKVKKPLSFALAFMLSLAIGISSELLQLSTSTRSFSWLDFAADAFGTTLALLFLALFEWFKN
ncbi:VanZ family protein [Candidatus Woesearchaeota archaeon]|nr:VanZ family protein [Candidatus Woesearchaeota archaeon]